MPPSPPFAGRPDCQRNQISLRQQTEHAQHDLRAALGFDGESDKAVARCLDGWHQHDDRPLYPPDPGARCDPPLRRRSRRLGLLSRLCSGDWAATDCTSPIVEGIGRNKVEPSFNPLLVDQMISVTDAGSVAGAHWLQTCTRRMFGPSTGTNVIGALILAQSLVSRGETGSIVTLGCDDGRRYDATIYDRRSLAEAQIDVGSWTDLLERLGRRGFPEAMLPAGGGMH